MSSLADYRELLAEYKMSAAVICEEALPIIDDTTTREDSALRSVQWERFLGFYPLSIMMGGDTGANFTANTDPILEHDDDNYVKMPFEPLDPLYLCPPVQGQTIRTYKQSLQRLMQPVHDATVSELTLCLDSVLEGVDDSAHRELKMTSEIDDLDNLTSVDKSPTHREITVTSHVRERGGQMPPTMDYGVAIREFTWQPNTIYKSPEVDAFNAEYRVIEGAVIRVKGSCGKMPERNALSFIPPGANILPVAPRRGIGATDVEIHNIVQAIINTSPEV